MSRQSGFPRLAPLRASLRIAEILGLGLAFPGGSAILSNRAQHGRLAQLVERLPYKQDVTGSSPVLPIKENPAS